ncbi:hypothetical protein BOTBODRAFT_536808 [Botryobasidium botryosum FD-172 SS1]|uniref:Uncharacterized protein n=1 Tax=Botryobasidium botryosum (strain FD-172 SS1) TaxID=930990 RepID=A0A067M081_BOTB1|nr:hypothetical protein BOTBODRAFT_536808 [Botryobasidium botryosum FD-172 SS1]
MREDKYILTHADSVCDSPKAYITRRHRPLPPPSSIPATHLIPPLPLLSSPHLHRTSPTYIYTNTFITLSTLYTPCPSPSLSPSPSSTPASRLTLPVPPSVAPRAARS